jgi:TM2 domain-containing membrane protein YozV
MQTGVPTYRRKSPSLAWFLSFLYPGMGQFYNGHTGKGITMMLFTTGGIGLCVLPVEKEKDVILSYGIGFIVIAAV